MFIIILVIPINAQETLHNFGNLKIHTDGALGFHHNLINDGFTDDNLGLVGFFGNESSTISGAFRPIFNDMEVMLEENLFLDIGVGIKRHLNFIDGTIVTPKNFYDINADFITEALYSGEDEDAKINGYAMMTEKDRFRFPIGDADRIRPLLLETESDTISAKSAYFLENPNTPTTFSESFDTSALGESVIAVSDIEFWHLDGATRNRVELIWDDRSDLNRFIDTIENLSIVGWHNKDKEWNDLGVAARKGDINFGRMVSDYFDLTEYSILTFGAKNGTSELLFTNYLITPNNDGDNDYLVLEAISISQNNELKIYNRWGRLVYSKENYDNSFAGKANSGTVLQRNKILPSGVYFYIINLKEVNKIHQGYLYINL